MDLFSCYFGNNNDFINNLESGLSINVRASTNDTGNTPFGDWIMETDNINIKNIYFNDDISSFNQVLFVIISRTLNHIHNEVSNTNKYIISANGGAFAAIKTDGSVFTWGDELYGGNSSSIPTELASGVVRIYANAGAFAALKYDGSVVTWGRPDYGANSSSVSSDLTSGVVKIYSSHAAFAALKKDGSVVTWGNDIFAHEPSTVSSDDLTSGVVKIYSSYGAFAALKKDGSVVTWGWDSSGANSSSVSSDLASGVLRIYSHDKAFAAIKTGGSVVTWGGIHAGDPLTVSSYLASGVVRIHSSDVSFAALKNDGSVFTWGHLPDGGDSSLVSSDLASGVVKIYANYKSFAALKNDGSVVTWGGDVYGGNSSSVSSKLASGVVKIYANYAAFAALKNDGSVVTWGSDVYGGNSSSVSSKLASGVVKIYANYDAFAALKNDGSVVTWGSSTGGGVVPSSVSSDLASGVVRIYASWRRFTALKNDGSVFMWGSGISGAVVHSKIVDASKYYELTSLTSDQLTDSSLLDDFPECERVVFSSSSSSSGDPYVTTLCGNKFKLPNANKTYRMVQFTDSKNKDLIVNASVSQLTTDEIEQLENIAMSFTNSKPVINGYFYENFYISYGSKYAVFDRHINLIDTNIIDNGDIQNEGITIKYETESKPFSCPIQGNSTSSDTIITIGDSIIRLQKINHPQIINGIEFGTANKNIDMVKGILNTYYHPKNYSIKKIDSTKQISNSNKKLYKKNIVEKWINV